MITPEVESEDSNLSRRVAGAGLVTGLEATQKSLEHDEYQVSPRARFLYQRQPTVAARTAPQPDPKKPSREL